MMIRGVCLAAAFFSCMNALAETNKMPYFSTLTPDFGLVTNGVNTGPVVVTPSKIAQPRADVSSSLSVLEGAFIRRTTMQYVEDLLQFVPGFSVAPFKTSSQKIVSYHGTQLDQYRRIQVLVNGRSVYSAGLARVEWATLPLNIEDVARVEINRGPNAASYGINSFFAVVNIITRSPLETLGDSLSAYSGSRGDYRLYGQHSGLKDDWSYRASASTTNVSGFDEDVDGDPRHDGYASTMGNVLFQHETTSSFFDADIGASHLADNIDPSQYLSAASYDTNQPTRLVDREHVKLSYTKQTSPNHEIKLQYYFDQSDLYEHHDVSLSPGFYAQLFGGVSTVSVYDAYAVDLLETRQDIELQSTWEVSDHLRLISAVGYRLEQAESEHFLSGKASDSIFRLSSNMEYRATQQWIFNSGVMLESSEMSGTFLSPKLGVTYKLSEQESLRANVSKAVRTPDISDQYFKWHYVLSDGLSSTTSYADKGEQEEKITSYEVGYYQYWPDKGLSFDLKIYHDDVNDLVVSNKNFSAFRQVDAPLQEGVTEDVFINGLEIEVDWRQSSGAMTRVTYAYQDTQTDNAELLKATTPRIMSVFGSLPVTDRLSVQGYYWYGKALGGQDYEFLNTWLSYKLLLGGYSKMQVGVGMETKLNDNAIVSEHNNYFDTSFAYVFTNITF
ncbi:TonB-dependent receptor plug domain-containing protein [Marinomonas sp. IMCC 4694]|uniref:TonB-dependent receptor plug domain-containing protein n=1 Tax=Marinomonas sp. IMCC 4694 TaxID=2605432 RepID=UPI0011E7984B|nr:TonB-dependent receptor [Marinomonas sp. IMCC 4694]TYL48285.1 TonB-dependent receptor plug domain-containing protein [Marinomonas sp. IMCC 4694]